MSDGTIAGAFVCRVSTRPHPNADRLKIGLVGGFSVVVGINTEDGERGLFFPSDLKVSPEYAAANDLLPIRDESGNRTGGGYFPESLRVRAQRFRGEASEGYFAPLSSLAFAGDGYEDLADGSVITEFNGVKICERWEKPRVAGSGGGSRKESGWMPKHVDTQQLGYFIDNILPGGVAYLTLKMHGTSGRTASAPVVVEEPRRWWQKLIGMRPVTRNTTELLTGSRNVTIAPKTDGYHGSNDFRLDCSDRIAYGGLYPGEVIYYEIVGYTNGTPIMGDQDFSGNSDKDLKKLGIQRFSYGCDPYQFKVFVYRITQMVEGQLGPRQIELSWPQVRARCHQLGLTPVPQLAGPILTETIAADKEGFLRAVVAPLLEGPDPVGLTHIREGVVLRVDSADGTTKFLKRKSLEFRVGEGIEGSGEGKYDQ